jgi:simple sugar transport system permease protein
VIQSPPVDGVSTVDLPFLAGGSLFGWDTPDFFGWLETQDWFFISDLAGVIRGFTGAINWLTLIGLALVPFTAWLLWRTPWGLRLRSCGEDPWAAESLGVPVLRMKYYGVVISGMLSGLAGAFLVLVQAGIYREFMTDGTGFIGLGALIFGNWLPVGVLGGSLVFGFGASLQLRGSAVVRSLILAVAIGLIVYGIYSFTRSKVRAAIIQTVIGAALLLYYLQVEEVSNQLLIALPYVITLLVLAAASQHLRMPAADGARYAKGEAR